jgi:hypothetical protein
MKNFFTQLTSISWWLSVVTVGFLINILSVYITRRLDTRLSRVSSWWRRKSDEKAARKKRDLAWLQQSQVNVTIFALAELRSRIRALTMLVLAFAAALLTLFVRVNAEKLAGAPIALILLKIAPPFLGALSIALYYSMILSAAYKQNLISEATIMENKKADKSSDQTIQQ